MCWHRHFKAKLSAISGFSLVEVMVAMGVLSFTLVSLFALLALGLRTSEQAHSLTIEAQVAQALQTEFHSLAYDELASLAVSPSAIPPRYYDVQGLEVAANSPQALFKATVAVELGAAGLGYEGMPASVPSANPDLALLVIEVEKLRGYVKDRVRVFPSLVSNYGF